MVINNFYVVARYGLLVDWRHEEEDVIGTRREDIRKNGEKIVVRGAGNIRIITEII